MNTRTTIGVFTLLGLLCGPAGAVGNLADVSIYDAAERRTLPVYRYDGRYYVAGRPGNEYRIRVRNRSGGEILAVVSVDAVNAVSGETAEWGQTGYVLSPRQSYDIAGWRKSPHRVAAFFFTRHENAYATRTGRPGNVGVLGIALFRKKLPPEPRLPHPHRRRGAPGESAFPDAGEGAESAAGRSERAAQSDAATREAPVAPMPERSLGTGHGRSRTSPVTYTAFERATAEPQEVIAIHYDTHQNLVALGVIRPPPIAVPTPFPRQFVPDSH